MDAARSIAAGQRFPYKRAYPRYPISAAAEATDPISKTRVTGCVTVIGRGGCYFRTTNTLDAGTMLQARIAWHETTFVTWARVVHSISGDGMGVAFFDVGPLELEVLERWLEELAAAEKSEKSQ